MIRTQAISRGPRRAIRTPTLSTARISVSSMPSVAPRPRPESPNCQAVSTSPSSANSGADHGSAPVLEPPWLAVTCAPSTRSTVWSSGPPSAKDVDGVSSTGNRGPCADVRRFCCQLSLRFVSVMTSRPPSSIAALRPGVSRSARYRKGTKPSSRPAWAAVATANPSPAIRTWSPDVASADLRVHVGGRGTLPGQPALVMANEQLPHTQVPRIRPQCLRWRRALLQRRIGGEKEIRRMWGRCRKGVPDHRRTLQQRLVEVVGKGLGPHIVSLGLTRQKPHARAVVGIVEVSGRSPPVSGNVVFHGEQPSRQGRVYRSGRDQKERTQTCQDAPSCRRAAHQVADPHGKRQRGTEEENRS